MCEEQHVISQWFTLLLHLFLRLPIRCCLCIFCSAGIFKTFAVRTCRWTLWQMSLTGCFYWELLKAAPNGRAITFMGSLRWHPCILDGLLNRSHQLQWFFQRWKQKQGGNFNCQHNANGPLRPSSPFATMTSWLAAPQLYVSNKDCFGDFFFLLPQNSHS